MTGHEDHGGRQDDDREGGDDEGGDDMTANGAGTPGRDEERRGEKRTRPEPMVAVRGLTRTYGSGSAAVRALRGVTLEVPRGEMAAVRGPSGAGKTTLLNLVGGLDRPDAGSVTVDGAELAGLGEKRLSALRRDRMGFVF